jgi:ubiquinone/menaquinone biosynthesis C-methylase UbiE
MTKTSSPLFPTVERFTGFAEVYDQYRPSPPAELGDILTQMIHMQVPALVVDLGCGTGLSTRFWADRARQVIGIDPNEEMLAVARARTGATNTAYVYGYGHQVALSSGCADIVTCSQSFHWMDPQLTLLEVARLLRPGGVFAVYDHTSLVMPGWEIEAAQRAFQDRADALENELGIIAQVPRWPKQEHLSGMQASDLFRYTREFYLHHVELGNAQSLIGGILSSGQIQSLFKAGVTEKELGLDVLRAQAHRLLGDEMRPWYLSVHVRIGIV